MIIPDSNIHGANMGPTWVLPAPDGPHVGPMNLTIRDVVQHSSIWHEGVHCGLLEGHVWLTHIHPGQNGDTITVNNFKSNLFNENWLVLVIFFIVTWVVIYDVIIDLDNG